MHPNAVTIRCLYSALARHDHSAMADCYAETATFRDIAFDLHGRRRIHAMWHMICESDLLATFDVVKADDHFAVANLVDDYTSTRDAFGGSSERTVHTVIESTFELRGGQIVSHVDACDPRQWAAMALGGLSGSLIGRFRLLRSLSARHLLAGFLARHPEYRAG